MKGQSNLLRTFLVGLRLKIVSIGILSILNISKAEIDRIQSHG